MGVRIQELPETTGINKEDLLIVEDGQGTKKGTVQQLDEALGVSQLKEDVAEQISYCGFEKDLCPLFTLSEYINEEGATVKSGDTLAHTDFIDISKFKSVIAFGLNGLKVSSIKCPSMLYYDNDKQCIGFTYNNDVYDASNDIERLNAKYAIINLFIDSEHKTDAVRLHLKINGEIPKLNKAVDDINVKLLAIETESSNQYVNIAENISSVNNKYLVDGELINHDNWCATENYIKVEPGESYGIKFKGQLNKWVTFQFAYYNDAKKYIGKEISTNNNVWTIPEDAKFIRIATVNKNFDPDNGHDSFKDFYIEKVESGSNVVVVDNEKYFKKIYPFSTLAKKKWSIFGDSLTENNFRSSTNYHDYVRAETGIITQNNGVGGSGYKSRQDTNNAFYQIAIKNKDLWKDADVITVLGGVNDMWTHIPSGSGLGTYTDTFEEPDDITLTTNNTVMACFNYLLDYLINNSESARIGIISPLPCYCVVSNKKYEEVPYLEDCNMSKFVNECKKSCAIRGIPYLDLFHNSGLRPWNEANNAKYFKTISDDSPDGLHPNELGHKYIYPMIREFLKALI